MQRLELRLLSELICGNAKYGPGAERVKANEGKFQTFDVPSPYRSEYEIKRFFSDNDLLSLEGAERAYTDAKSGTIQSRHEISIQMIEPICRSENGNLSSGAACLVLALADPRSYTTSSLAQDGVDYLNAKILNFYDKKIELKNGIKPILQPLTYESANPDILNYDLPEFESVVYESVLVKLLEERWEEMKVCSESGAFLSATILLTGILEAVLKDRVLTDVEKAKKATSLRGIQLSPEQWSLEQLIKCCVEVGWISKEREAFLEVARQMRNFVHLHLYLRQKGSLQPNRGTVRTGIAVIYSTVEDLQKAI